MRYYKISEEELQRLLEQAAIYEALHYGGVDNWDGYGWAIESYCEELGSDIDEVAMEDLSQYEVWYEE